MSTDPNDKKDNPAVRYSKWIPADSKYDPIDFLFKRHNVRPKTKWDTERVLRWFGSLDAGAVAKLVCLLEPQLEAMNRCRASARDYIPVSTFLPLGKHPTGRWPIEELVDKVNNPESN